jgi:hypothetical protein
MEMLLSIAPFVLLLVLWFLMMRSLRAEKQKAKESPLGGQPDMVPANVVAEIRALRESVDSLRKEMADRR